MSHWQTYDTDFIIQLEIVQIIKKRKYSAAINLLQFPKIHRKKTVQCPKQDKNSLPCIDIYSLYIYKSILQHKNTLSQELFCILSNTTLNNCNVNRNYIHMGKYTHFQASNTIVKTMQTFGTNKSYGAQFEWLDRFLPFLALFLGY